MGILEKIKDIELEMSRTQKNKATEGHLGILKSKLAKLRTQLLAPSKTGGGDGEGFEVSKYGHGRVALIGFPSVGKSTLLTLATGTDSEAAAYEFTTLTCIPGVIHYNDAKIQLLDLPGIIEGASEGKGRGRQVIAVAKSADLILMVLDATKSEAANSQYAHKEILTRELEAVGLRLNQSPPQVYMKQKHSGGVQLSNTVPGGLTKISEATVLKVLAEYKIHHCELLIREDITVDQLIDVLEGNRKYVRCLYVYNKADALTIEEVDQLSRRPDSVCISCHMELGLDHLLRRMWDAMGLGARVHQENWKQTRFRRARRPGRSPRRVHGEALLRTDSQHAGEDAQVRASVGARRRNTWDSGWVSDTPSRTRTSSRSSRATKRDPDDLKGRFSTTKRNDPDRIADRVKKTKLKT